MLVAPQNKHLFPTSGVLHSGNDLKTEACYSTKLLCASQSYSKPRCTTQLQLVADPGLVAFDLTSLTEKPPLTRDQLLAAAGHVAHALRHVGPGEAERRLPEALLVLFGALLLV